jgi:hypothetical protein
VSIDHRGDNAGYAFGEIFLFIMEPIAKPDKDPILNLSSPNMQYLNKSYFIKYLCFASFLCSALAMFPSRGYSAGSDPLEKYLPDSVSTGSWKADGKPKIFKGKQLYDYIDGGAEIFYEYGFTQAIAQRYILGDKSITVDIYEMTHPKAAFGIFSVQRDSEMPPLEAGDDGTASDAMVAFCQERFYVVITANKPAPGTKQASIQIARAVSQKIRISSPLPDLTKMLPASHLVPRSTGYVSGLLGLNTQFYLGDSNILGINGHTVECVFARYKIQENQANLLVVRYPDPAAANAALNAAKEAFTKKYKAVTIKDISAFSDKRNLFYHLTANNKFLYLISRSSSVDLIKEIESSINLPKSKLK